MHPDGSDLPRAPSTGGGVVKVLREECCTSQSLKGKAGGKRDSPPHMAHYASLQTGGKDLFIKDILTILSSPPTAFPVTCSQIKDMHFDPLKGKCPNNTLMKNRPKIGYQLIKGCNRLPQLRPLRLFPKLQYLIQLYQNKLNKNLYNLGLLPCQ